MSTFLCQGCGSPNVRIQGPPIIWEFDEEGPVSYTYDDDVESIPLEGRTTCLNCGYEAGTWRFKRE